MTTAARPDTLLPDPEPRTVRYTVISVDDHLVEPPDMFEGRLPSRFADQAPKIVENSKGHQLWEFDGALYSQVGMNAVAGRRPEFVSLEPTRFEDMRRGCWDIDARIADMDINGVWASLNFPSQITGFSRRVFSGSQATPNSGFAVTRAWNDWLYEAWWQPYPDRIIPCGITFLADPETGAAEIRRNAERGLPVGHSPRTTASDRSAEHLLWLLGSDRRCVRRDRDGHLAPRRIVGHAGHGSGRPMVALGATLFGQMSLSACAEWIWSGPAGALPGHQHRHERRRHRLGGHAARPARTTSSNDQATARDYDPTGLLPAEVSRGTSGSARSTTPRPSRPATGSGSITSWSRSTTPTATPPGRTPRRSSSAAGVTFRSRTCGR